MKWGHGLALAAVLAFGPGPARAAPGIDLDAYVRKDTFVEAGKGFGATYSGLWPLVRIDYVLYPKHFKAVSHRTPRLKYSDHYPVVAEITI